MHGRRLGAVTNRSRALAVVAKNMVERAGKTNGALVRLVGRNRIRDGVLTSFVWTLAGALSAGLVPLYWLLRAKQVRPGACWAAVRYQIFGWGERQCMPEGRQCIPEGRQLRGGTARTELSFVFISDTHNLHAHIAVPYADVVVHAGDFTNHGSKAEVEAFARWFGALPHPHKILVPGNHDMIMDPKYYADYWSDWSPVQETVDPSIWSGVHVLVDRRVEIQGVAIYGSPWVPRYAEWSTAFNKTPDQLDAVWSAVPHSASDQAIDVLVTHSPPLGVLDRCLCERAAPHMCAGDV